MMPESLLDNLDLLVFKVHFHTKKIKAKETDGDAEDSAINLINFNEAFSTPKKLPMVLIFSIGLT